MPCRSDGTYAAVEEWPTCRARRECTAEPPAPPVESGLANTTSADPATEGDQVVYQCADETFGLKEEDGESQSRKTLVEGQVNAYRFLARDFPQNVSFK